VYPDTVIGRHELLDGRSDTSTTTGIVSTASRATSHATMTALFRYGKRFLLKYSIENHMK